MVEAGYRVKEARQNLYNKNGRQASHEELAEATGLTMSRLSNVLLAPKPPRSLDQKIGFDLDLKPSVGPIFFNANNNILFSTSKANSFAISFHRM